ncbi:tape measure protein [Pseudomonas hunanensis]|uniref:tape measure protein n=1 Tax=Pseudomonas hunanensis TaxID=1247546 RepID=UPI00380198B3
MLQTEIARLVGTLKFDINGMPKLRQFQAQMEKTGLKYSKLAEQLNKKIALPAPDTKAFDKAMAAYNAKLERQSNIEAALSNQRNKVFKKELATRKLLNANTKEDKRLHLPSMDSVRADAVAKSKARAQYERDNPAPKKRGRPASAEKQLTAEKIKLARLEQIHAKTQSQSMAAQAKLAGQMTRNQLLAVTLEAKKADQATKAIKERQRVEDRAARAARTAENHAERQQRFKWAQDRQTHWEANKNAPRGFLGRLGGVANTAIGELGMGGAAMRAVSGFAAALGPAGLALIGLTAAVAGTTAVIGKLNDMADKQETSVKTAESYNSSFNSLSQDPNVRKQWRQRFMESQISTGGAIDVETARDFKTFASTQQAFGKNMDQTIKAWEQRGKMFTITGASQDDRREVNRQLNQMQADGNGDKADWNIISERIPMLAPYVAKEFAKANNIKGSTEDQMAAFTKHLKKGKGFEYKWVEGAINQINSEKNAQFLEGLQSVTNARQQLENKKFLADNQIHSDAELADAAKARIAAQSRLAESMVPFNEAMAKVSETATEAATGITNLSASILDFASSVIPGMKSASERKEEAQQTNYRTAWSPSPLKDGAKEDQAAMAKYRKQAFTLTGPLPGTAGAPLVYPKATLDALRNPPSVPTMQSKLPDSLVPRDQLTMQDVKAALNSNIGGKSDVDGNNAAMSLAPIEIKVDQTFNVQAYDPAEAADKLGRQMRETARTELTQQIENARARQKDNR